MKQNNLQLNKIGKILFVASCLLTFLLSFSLVIHRDWGLIFKKDLYTYDESTNSVISANLTRKFFPAMVRVNPLVEEISIWEEGPYWQHIPPLFAYVPLLIFKIDQQITIEMKRLSYAGVILLTGIIFLLTVYWFEKTVLSLLAAMAATVLFVFTKFTTFLITGLSYGASDIVLAFSVISAFAAICWYLNFGQPMRYQYSIRKLFIISLVIALPIMVKNILGAIPVATFFWLVIKDQKSINRKVIISFLVFVGVLFIYFVPLYLSSPSTFKQEIFVSIEHANNFEGWARPWHIFLTSYIPLGYTGYLTPLYGLSILMGLWLLIKNKFSGKTKTILTLSIVWFLWNLLTVSVIKSKAPNFIFQTYLLSLFFSTYIPLLLFSETQFYRRLTASIGELRQNALLFIVPVLSLL